MELEDAHGAELWKIIEASRAQSESIIQGMVAHAPLVANELLILNNHYHNTLLCVEKAIRQKQYRPGNELEQLEILAEFNQYVGHHAQRANIKASLTNHLVVYGVRYGGGMGHHPIREYLTPEGVLKVERWYAHRTASGKPRIVEILENGKKSDGYTVITEVLDVTAMEEVIVSEVDFVQMLLADRNLEPDSEQAIWVNERICYKRGPFQPMHDYGWFGRNYPAFRKTAGRTPIHFHFQHGYPFWVGERKQAQYNIFNDYISSAICFDSEDGKYAFVVYRAAGRNPAQYLIYEHESKELKQYWTEYWVSGYLKNTLEFMGGEPDTIGPFDLSETHPYTLTSLQPDEIPESIPTRQYVNKCVKVTFDDVQLIDNGLLNRCKHVYIYSQETESDGKIVSKVHMRFEYDLVEDISFEKIIGLSNY
jgi:hypothetical protein